MENQVKPLKIYAQDGNALIITLVIIGLLAGLTMTLTRMSSKTSGNVSDEKASMSAEALMRTAQSYEGALQRLVNFNKCSENEFNFDNTETSVDYANAGAPTDKHCDVFDVAGAGLKYTAPDASALDDTHTAKADYGEWSWKSSACVLEIGTGETTCSDTSESELMIMVPYINDAVCIQINRMNGITNPVVSGSEVPPSEAISGASKYTGTFSTADNSIGDSGTGTALVRHATGCFSIGAGSWAGSNAFYHVILVR